MNDELVAWLAVSKLDRPFLMSSIPTHGDMGTETLNRTLYSGPWNIWF